MTEDIAKSLATTAFAGVCGVIVFSFAEVGWVFLVAF
jgi:hypothetical protein